MLTFSLALIVVMEITGGPLFVHSSQLPNGWLGCKRSDPNRDKCVTNGAQIALTSIAKSGLKKYGIFPAEPLRFTTLVIDQPTGPVNIKLNFTDLDVFGIKELKVNRATWKGNSINLDLTSPKLIVVGDYAVNGNVLILPIVGQGRSNITIDKCNLEAELKLKEYTKDKTTFFECEKILLKITGDRVFFMFENLFNGDKRLGDNMNKFLNENWQLIWMEVQPAIQNSIEQAIEKIANRMFSKLPSRDIAPL